MLSEIRIRLRALFRRQVVEQELEDELHFHLEHEVEKHVRAGLTRAQAERRAHAAFGGLDVVKEEARDARGIALLDALLQDLRYAWRALRARPGFAAGVILTLGLGMGANTAMFGIVDRLLLRPPAGLRAAERVHRVYVSYLWNGNPTMDRQLAYLRYLDLGQLSRSFEASAAFATRPLPVGEGEQTRELEVTAASASYFDFFAVRPVLGRFYTRREDERPAGARVAVLGYGFWQSQYAGSRTVLGQTLHVGEAAYTIIGVAPKPFVGIAEGRAPAVFIPITAYGHARNTDFADHYGWSWLEMMVRRRPGESIDAANADLSAAHARSWEQERQRSSSMPSAEQSRAGGELASVLMGRGPQAGADAKVVAWVMGVALVVLLIACANVINLLLARALHRRREIALRLALGITRVRLLQQLMVESLLFALLGGALGLALAQWGGGALRSLFPGADSTRAVATDARTLAFMAVLTLGLVLLTGLTPALQTLRSDLAGALKAGMRDSAYRKSRLRTGLLLFQGALSVMLLVGAGLFVRSLLNVRSFRLGYDVDNVIYVDAELRGANLKQPELYGLLDRLQAAAQKTPGVHSATLAVSVPFWGSEGRGVPFVPGRDSIGRLGRFTLQTGSVNYFETMGTRIVRGRGFTEQDGANALPIVVVTQAMARALWPGLDPIGKQMRIGNDTMPFLTVVGVAEDIRSRRIRDDPNFWYYLPVAQYRKLFGASRGGLFVRVRGNTEDQLQSLRQRLQAEMPAPAYIRLATMHELIEPQRRSWQFGATMFVAFAALALILAAIGLYSVIAYAVAQRTRELGVRIALGASTRSVLGLIAGQGIVFAVAGISLGSAAALVAARWVEPLLFSVSARDPLVYATVAGLLIIVALAATLRPALRATRVDPLIALRAD
ncbi:MAG: ADOP family duplicated permease [Longimicrobiales bacterium]